MRRPGRAVLLAVAVALLVAAGALEAVSGAGRFLIVQDPIDRADALVVLAGGRSDERVRQGAALYRAGYAPLVILSGGDPIELDPRILMADVMRQQALRLGVPPGAIVLERRSRSTEEEALDLYSLLRTRGVRRAIVVTSTYHTRRSRFIFRRVFAGSGIDIRIYPVQRDVFSPSRWWTREWDLERVVLEYVKFTVTLLRAPWLRPQTRPGASSGDRHFIDLPELLA